MVDSVDEFFGEEESSGIIPQRVQGKLETKVSVKNNIENTERVLKEETKTIETKLFKQSPSYLNVRFSTTVNLGNYQTAKVEKGIFVPVGSEVDSELVKKISATDSWASKLLNDLIEKDVKPILKHLKDKNQ